MIKPYHRVFLLDSLLRLEENALLKQTYSENVP